MFCLNTTKQRRGTEPGSVVLRQQSVSEHHKNKRTHTGLQEPKWRPGPTTHQWGLCGEGPHLQITGSPPIG